MPSKKKRSKAAPAPSEDTPDAPPAEETSPPPLPPPTLPFARYISLLGVHLTLSAFAALALPRSSSLLGISIDTAHAQTSSLDRPQHDFLAPITANPVLTLASLVLGSAILQSWWSGFVRHWWFEVLEGERVREKKDVVLPEQRDLVKRKLRAVRSAATTTLATSFMFYTIFVLFGALVASHYVHTYLLALLLSILTVHTPAYTIGTPSFASDTQSLMARLTWTRLFAELAPKSPLERIIVYPAVGALLGCWSGVMPIPLDWDRPWQAWPLTLAYGAIVGQIVGSACAAASVGWTLLTQMGRGEERARTY